MVDRNAKSSQRFLKQNASGQGPFNFKKRNDSRITLNSNISGTGRQLPNAIHSGVHPKQISDEVSLGDSFNRID